MTNLYLSMLERVGAPVARLGDSTGPLEQLTSESAPTPETTPVAGKSANLIEAALYLRRDA